jgi:hypothetical protein
MGRKITIYIQGQPVEIDEDLISGLSYGGGGGYGYGGIPTPKQQRYSTRIRKANDIINNTASTAEDVAGAKEALATAKEEKLGAALTGGIGAAPQVIGGIVGGIQAQQRLNKLKKFGIPDLMPESLKQGMGEAQLAAGSAKVSNYAQQAAQNEANANLATNQIIAAAPSAEQAIAGATRVQAMRNRAYNNLASQGLASQQERKNRLNEFRKMRAQYDDENRKTREALITDAKNARNQNFLNAGTGIAKAVLLAGA